MIIANTNYKQKVIERQDSPAQQTDLNMETSYIAIIIEF